MIFQKQEKVRLSHCKSSKSVRTLFEVTLRLSSYADDVEEGSSIVSGYVTIAIVDGRSKLRDDVKCLS